MKCQGDAKCVFTGHPYKGDGTWESHCECDRDHKGALCQSKCIRSTNVESVVVELAVVAVVVVVEVVVVVV